jgi:methionyl-tRNA formyltransferase
LKTGKYRIVFMGTPEFAVPTLKALTSDEEVTLVVTNPDRPKGRGRSLTPPPVKEAAASIGIPVYQPVGLKGNAEALSRIEGEKPHFIVVAAYGKILPPEVLEIPRFLPLNVHASLLPGYRGAAPINWAIINGEKKTGITIMEMEAGLDSGPILLTKMEEILPEDTAHSLAIRLSRLGAQVLSEALLLHRKGELKGVPQDHGSATYAPMIKKETGRIDWSKEGKEIRDLARGLLPWPGAFTTFGGKGMKILSCETETLPTAKEAPPGEILETRKDGIVVKCGRGNIRITRLQPEGKREIDAWSFVQGYRVEAGQRLGP